MLTRRIDGMKIYLPSGAVTPSTYAGLMVNRAEFDRALAAQVVEAGAEIMIDAALVSLDADRQTAQIRRAGRTREIVRLVLVGADGPHSTTARLKWLLQPPIIHIRQYTVPLTEPYADTDSMRATWRWCAGRCRALIFPATTTPEIPSIGAFFQASRLY